MEEMNAINYPVLSDIIDWDIVKTRFSFASTVNESLTSNVSIVPYVGDKYVIIQLENGRWELPGGTLEVGESYMDAIKRETMEEVGGILASYRIFGKFDCESIADKPFRPHIPHPKFIRIIGYGEVDLVSKPLNPEDGEEVITVELVDINTAIHILKESDRYVIAELYKLAHEIRTLSK